MFKPKSIHDRHNEILNTIKKKDELLIEKIIREHYVSAGEIISKYTSDKYHSF